ncbi:MAG: hypothetical protein HC834_10180 [Rhodospirillales bacterium]|nr:hypothetical protein [Rhodospirillales bacterium]
MNSVSSGDMACANAGPLDIHSSVVSTIFAKSALVMRRFGNAAPTPADPLPVPELVPQLDLVHGDALRPHAVPQLDVAAAGIAERVVDVREGERVDPERVPDADDEGPVADRRIGARHLASDAVTKLISHPIHEVVEVPFGKVRVFHPGCHQVLGKGIKKVVIHPS